MAQLFELPIRHLMHLFEVLGYLPMLNNAICFKQIFIVTCYTDLRSGIDRLAALITSKTGDNPFRTDTLYLFCGRKTDRISELTWERDGFTPVQTIRERRFHGRE